MLISCSKSWIKNARPFLQFSSFSCENIRYLSCPRTLICTAFKSCLRDTKCVWFKALAHMKRTSFTTVLVTLFTNKTVLQSIFWSVIQQKNIFRVGRFSHIRVVCRILFKEPRFVLVKFSDPSVVILINLFRGSLCYSRDVDSLWPTIHCFTNWLSENDLLPLALLCATKKHVRSASSCKCFGM
jgi:hypothetical protein